MANDVCAACGGDGDLISFTKIEGSKEATAMVHRECVNDWVPKPDEFKKSNAPVMGTHFPPMPPVQ